MLFLRAPYDLATTHLVLFGSAQSSRDIISDGSDGLDIVTKEAKCRFDFLKFRCFTPSTPHAGCHGNTSITLHSVIHLTRIVSTRRRIVM